MTHTNVNLPVWIDTAVRYSRRIAHLAATLLRAHDRIIEQSEEGTVWKDTNGIYEPRRRGRHWIKRKRSAQMEAFISGFKLGTPGRGNEYLIKAIEFSVGREDDSSQPIAWFSSWTDEKRKTMTWKDRDGNPMLNLTCYERRATLPARYRMPPLGALVGLLYRWSQQSEPLQDSRHHTI